MSIFGVFLVRIFQDSDSIRTRKTPNLDTSRSVYHLLVKAIIKNPALILFELSKFIFTQFNLFAVNQSSLLTLTLLLLVTEAAVSRCSSKLVFFKLLQHSQENDCVRVSF